MRSTFSGLNIARSGFFAAQRALDITGHNIANVNTRGYTRQRLEQSASNPLRIPGGEGMLGTGVTTTAIHQLRNDFLDYKYREESSTFGFWDAKADGLSFIESIINEPSETGIISVIDELFASFEELSKNANNLTIRALVRQRAVTFTNSINHIYNQLEKMATDLNFDVSSAVKQINTLGEGIAKLNDQIMRSEVDGSNANDLRDQRNVLIDDLSRIIDIEVMEIRNPDNPKDAKMVIKIAGKSLVYHSDFTGLEVNSESRNFAGMEDKQIDFYEIEWADGTEFDVTNIGGELAGLLSLRDGEGPGVDKGTNGEEGKNREFPHNQKGIPYYIRQLNRFANVFANEINKIHLEGYGLNKETGIAFFTAGGVATPENAQIELGEDGNCSNDHDEFSNINASNIRIAADIEDLNNIAASKEQDLLPKDGSIMLDIIALRHKVSMFNEGKPEDFLKSLIGTLGVDAEEANRNTFNQGILLQDIENRRQSISGVFQDEELANMVRFQHAYNASARMITTMDEMLDVLINRVGIVGR
ncbi:MAG TPA: flagellar hook-associated protein FlgK [Clostridia bacterium]|nr:flagellar hook-associated protein FlgK [Clostridia bacterium]